jgi:hypothetical protein
MVSGPAMIRHSIAHCEVSRSMPANSALGSAVGGARADDDHELSRPCSLARAHARRTSDSVLRITLVINLSTSCGTVEKPSKATIRRAAAVGSSATTGTTATVMLGERDRPHLQDLVMTGSVSTPPFHTFED